MAGKSAVTIEIGWRDPFDVAKTLADVPGFAFLDSALFHRKLGRYSFIGIDPFGTLTVTNGQAAWNGETLDAPPLEALRGLLRQYSLVADPALPPFQGGVIGAIPYEFGWQLEILRAQDHVVEAEPVHLAFYDLILAFDQLEHRFFIMSSGFPEQDEKRESRAAARIEEALALIDRPRESSKASSVNAVFSSANWRSNMSGR